MNSGTIQNAGTPGFSIGRRDKSARNTWNGSPQRELTTNPLSGKLGADQRSQGGTTCLTNLLLLCPFHHLIWIHRWGWTITLNPDATTTATSPNHTTTLHSHGPPHTTAA